MQKLIPITLITGFLGSGKTTLLNHLIIQNPDKKVVVIENEFGEIGIDGALLVDLDAQIFELNNGCICCNLNEDLQETLLKLLEIENRPEQLIIETTGIADPSPIIASLLNDEIIQSNFKIDGIITLVDALFIEKQLEEHPQCTKQIALGNFIIVNKIATVPKQELQKIIEKIAGINPDAQIFATNFSEVKDIDLFKLDAFSEHMYNSNSKRTFTVLNNSPYARKHEITATVHDETQSIYVSSSRPMDIIKFDAWLKALMGNHFGHIYRVKGFVSFEDFDFKVIIQGVQNMYVSEKGSRFLEDEPKATHLVFIGRKLNKELLIKGLEACLANEQNLDFKIIYDNIEAIQEHFLA